MLQDKQSTICTFFFFNFFLSACNELCLLRLVSIHVLAGHTTALDTSQYIDTSIHYKSLRACNNVEHVELLRGMRGMTLEPRYTVSATYRNRECRIQKYFLPSRKKSKTKEQFCNNHFRKVVIYSLIQDALRDSHTSECKRPYNRTYDGCLGKPAEGKKVRTSKQLRFVSDLLDNKLMH